MNKFVCVLTVCAFAVAAISGAPVDVETDSEFSLVTSNDEEVAGLSGDAAIFSDFCIRSRDFLFGDIKSKTNGAASSVFKMLFNSAIDVGNEAIATQTEALNRIGNQIAHPDAEIAETDGSDAQQYLANGQSHINQVQVQPASIFAGIKATLQATGTAVAQAAAKKINALKEQLGTMAVVAAAGDACDQAAAYDKQLREQFNEFQSEVASKSPALGKLTYEQVNCVTTGRLAKLDGFCSLVVAARGPVLKMFNRH